jgi:hypothetical protein
MNRIFRREKFRVTAASQFRVATMNEKNRNPR